MKTFFFPLYLLISFFYVSACDKADNLVKPTEAQIAWANAEIGVLIHYDMNVFAPDLIDYANPATLPDLKIFNPTKLNTDQWMEAAQAVGAKYAVLVVKHGTGFCLWPTKAYPYHVGNTPWRNGQGNIVSDFIQSCKKYNIMPGLYYNTNYSVYFGAGYQQLPQDKMDAYHKVVIEQLTDLWTKYGPLFEIWFDGGVMTDEKGGIASDVNQLIAQYQSDAILFQGPAGAKNLVRWIGNEDGRGTYPNWSTTDQASSSEGEEEDRNLNGSPDGKIWCPAEADFPNRNNKTAWCGGWFWKAGEDEKVFSVDDLLDRYYTCVGMNANMLVGMAIDTAGLFPETDMRNFVQFGKEIKYRFDTPIAETKGKGKTIVLEASELPVVVNHVVIQEDIAQGERIRKYTVEAKVEGEWIEVCNGISVGHKRIQKFDPVKTTSVRLRVEESVCKPVIKKLAVYNIQ